MNEDLKSAGSEQSGVITHPWTAASRIPAAVVMKTSAMSEMAGSSAGPRQLLPSTLETPTTSEAIIEPSSAVSNASLFPSLDGSTITPIGNYANEDSYTGFYVFIAIASFLASFLLIIYLVKKFLNHSK